MDINSMDQGLLIRNPSMTSEEFSHHWYHNHAPFVIPMFLFLGVQHYQQIHPPFKLTSSSTKPPLSLDLNTFDGVAGLPPQSTLDLPSTLPKWVQAYYDEIIKVDERRFLISEALEHIIRVPPQTVEGDVRAVIREGKALIGVPESVWRVWRQYEERGRKEEDREKERERERER